MSLNRSAQIIYDYIRSHPDEDRHWREKAGLIATQSPDHHIAASTIVSSLRDYCEERAGSLSQFRDLRQIGGFDRSTLRPLAELLVRLWGPPPKKKKPSTPPAL